MVENLQGMRAEILTTDLFEDAELTEPRKALRDAGARTVIIAPHSGEIQAVNHDTKTQNVNVDLTLDLADPGLYEAVLMPGGAMNAGMLRTEKRRSSSCSKWQTGQADCRDVLRFPGCRFRAGLVKGRHMTSYSTIQDDLPNAGSKGDDAATLVYRDWVNSRPPSDIPQFNRKMIQLFADVHGQDAQGGI